MVCRLPAVSYAAVLILTAAVALPASAQTVNPGDFNLPLTFGAAPEESERAKVSAVLRKIDDSQCALEVTMTLPAGAHTYSMNPSFGSATSIRLTDDAGLEPVGEWQSDRAPKSVFDDLLQQQVEKFYDRVVWTRTYRGVLKAGLTVSGTLSGLYCNESECRPEKAKFTAVLGDAPSGGDASVDGGGTRPAFQTVTPVIGFGKSAKAGQVVFEISLTPENAKVGDEVALKIRTQVEEGWHIFAVDQDPEMAGLPTEIKVETRGLEAVDSAFTPSSAPEIENPLPDITQRVHYGEVTWSRRYRVTDASAEASGSVRFQICETVCKPPTTAKFAVSLTAGSSGASQTSAEPVAEAAGGAGSSGPDVAPGPKGPGTENVESGNPEAASAGNVAGAGEQNFLAFMITAITAGFVALATPCVFPMIPITVAFFLKQEEKRAGTSLRLAVVYCLSIIAAFTILGLAMARIFGGTSLTSLANNPWLNLFFSALFVFFALMLLGLFDLQVPSWLLNWTAQKESTGGMVGVVFMALTFTLVSFTCTFAFVGTLLVLAAQGDYLWPIFGMLGFSTAFASPFFFLALFPGLLKKMPRSGTWMNEVKFIIGLVELAIVVKFLSVADIMLSADGVPVLVTYHVFLWTWIVVSAFAGLYLLRRRNGAWPRFSVARLIFVLGFFGFSGRLAAGLFGVSVGSDPVWNLVAAFAPPETRSSDVVQEEDLGHVIVHHGQAWSLEYPKAVAAAQKAARPLLVEITGQNCPNCRLMERTVLSQKPVLDKLAQLVRVQLYIDIVPGISDVALRESLVEANQNLASELLSDVTMPSYAIVSPDGAQVYAIFTKLDKTGGKAFLEFLEEGLGRWKVAASSGQYVASEIGR
jgi:thiol:disulfide interchange protein DsbD